MFALYPLSTHKPLTLSFIFFAGFVKKFKVVNRGKVKTRNVSIQLPFELRVGGLGPNVMLSHPYFLLAMSVCVSGVWGSKQRRKIKRGRVFWHWHLACPWADRQARWGDWLYPYVNFLTPFSNSNPLYIRLNFLPHHHHHHHTQQHTITHHLIVCCDDFPDFAFFIL